MITTYAFTPTGLYEDWRFTYELSDISEWDPLTDEVVLVINPDAITWDDYGLRTYAPVLGGGTPANFFQASSQDGSGYVVLTDPNLIDIVVPWNQMQRMGPGTAAVAISYRRMDTGSRKTILAGRLPIHDTGGA